MEKMLKVKSKMLNVDNQRGQVLIIIILTLLVVSLVVLAVASRSITDVKISTVNEESARAFSAAEAGVEAAVQYIRQETEAGRSPVTTSPVTPLPNQASYSYEIGLQGGQQEGQKSFLSSAQLSSDLATFQVYLERPGEIPSDYTPDDICLLWGNDKTTDTPSLEATVVYRDAGGVITNGRSLITAASGPCNKDIAAEENNLGVGRKFQYSNRLTLPGASGERLVMRIRLLGNLTTAHYVGVTPQGAALPSQGYKITSIGTSGEATRKVEVLQAYPAVPAIFDFSLYNDTGQITK